LVALSLSGLPSHAQDQLPPSSESVIDLLAKRAEQEQRVMASLLERYGFPPRSWSEQDWRLQQLSAYEQLEFAWRSAEKARTGTGDLFLANVTSEYRELNTSAAADPVLRNLRHSGRTTFEFALLHAPDFAAPLPESIERILDAVSRHADGALRGHMGRCCGIEGTSARQIFRSAQNAKDALRLALRQGTLPPELVNRIARLLESVSAFDSSVAFATELAQVRDQLRALNSAQGGVGHGEVAVLREQQAMNELVASLERAMGTELVQARQRANVPLQEMRYARDVLRLAEPVDRVPDQLIPERSSQVPSFGGAGGGGGGGGAGARPNAARNAAFDLRQYGPRTTAPAQRSFTRVVARAGGRGGVVFGNAVSAAPDLGNALTIAWVPLDSGTTAGFSPEALGTFRISLDDGNRVVFSRAVPAAEALAAVRLVFTGLPGVTPSIIEGEEIGMAGLESHFEIPTVTPEKVVVDHRFDRNKSFEARGTSYVVHPAIADTPIGRSAIITDGLLMGKSKPIIEKLLSESTTGDKFHLYTQWRQRAFWTYKFIDQPLELRVLHGGKIVRAVPKQIESDFANTPALTLRRFGSPGMDGADAEGLLKEDLKTLSTVMAMLVDASADIARLDRFAEVLAVLRWARTAGGVWIGGLPSEVMGVVLSATLLRNGQVELAPSKETFALSIAQQVHRRALEKLQRDAAPAALAALEAEVFERRSRIIAIKSAQGLLADGIVLQAFVDEAQKPLAAPAIRRAFSVASDALRSATSENEREEARKLALREARRILPEGRVAQALSDERGVLWAADPGKLEANAILVHLRPKLDANTLALIREAEARLAQHEASISQLDQRVLRLRQLLARQETANPDEIRAFALDTTRERYDELTQALTTAEREGYFKATWYRLRLWWLGAAPAPERLEAAVQKALSDRGDTVIKRDFARNQADGEIIPGFSDWHAFHRSYADACPTGVCTE
jgi:hypothetical protein